MLLRSLFLANIVVGSSSWQKLAELPSSLSSFDFSYFSVFAAGKIVCSKCRNGEFCFACINICAHVCTYICIYMYMCTRLKLQQQRRRVGFSLLQFFWIEVIELLFFLAIFVECCIGVAYCVRATIVILLVECCCWDNFLSNKLKKLLVRTWLQHNAKREIALYYYWREDKCSYTEG